MSHFQRLLLSAGLLAGALLAPAARAAAPTPPKKAAPSATRELVGETRAPLLLAAARAVDLKARPIGPRLTPERVELFVPPPRPLNVSLDILVHGRPLPTVRHVGKTYLPVPRVGAEYTIRVWNHGPRRVAAIVSVDGLSVINGRAASADGPGYLVAPYSHIVIKGWRRNLDAVAAFRFVDQDKSYAARTGRPENVGVIGLVAIEEAVWRSPPQLLNKGAAPAGKRGRAEVGSIGTEYGREVDSRAYYVPFVRSSNRQTVTLYYDTAEALRKAGVPVDRPAPVPFPADSEFAPPPPGYRGR